MTGTEHLTPGLGMHKNSTGPQPVLEKITQMNFGKASQMPTTQTSPKPTMMSSRIAKWVDQLFLRLGAIYGTKFGNQYRGMKIEVIKSEWGNAIFHLNGEVIRQVLDDLRNGATLHRDWPPTIPEFVALAKSVTNRQKPVNSWLIKDGQNETKKRAEMSPEAKKSRQELKEWCRRHRSRG